MPIFNSLGSNYTLSDALIALRELVWPNQRAKKALNSRLTQPFSGQSVLLFNGRDAIEYCLKAYGIGKDDQILTQAFSCSSLEEAITRTGAAPIYFDLEPGKVHTTLAQVKKAYTKAKQPRAIILQHTLGYPDQVIAIAEFCREKNLILIEDLAQAMGAQDAQGNQLGSQADAVILSFGRDKILDAISGGAVIFRQSSPHKPDLPNLEDWFELKHDKQNKALVLKLLLYPALSILVRSTYSFKIGKGLHWFFRRFKLMEQQIASPHDHYQSFPAYFAPLVLKRLDNLGTQLAHRRQLANLYYQQLEQLPLLDILVDQAKIATASNLRFPVAVSQPTQVLNLLNHLQKQGFHLHDRWYRKAVDSGSCNFSSVYEKKSCPNAESLAKRVINLPTHRGVTTKQAAKLTDLIKDWLKVHHE